MTVARAWWNVGLAALAAATTWDGARPTWWVPGVLTGLLAAWVGVEARAQAGQPDPQARRLFSAGKVLLIAALGIHALDQCTQSDATAATAAAAAALLAAAITEVLGPASAARPWPWRLLGPACAATWVGLVLWRSAVPVAATIGWAPAALMLGAAHPGVALGPRRSTWAPPREPAVTLGWSAWACGVAVLVWQLAVFGAHGSGTGGAP